MLASAFQYSHKPFGSEIKEVENTIKDPTVGSGSLLLTVKKHLNCF